MSAPLNELRHAIRDAAAELREQGDEKYRELPARMLSIVSKFAGSEVSVWGYRAPDQSHHIQWHPRTLDLGKYDEAYESLVHEHPVRNHFRATGTPGPHRLSDHISLGRFKSGGLYSEYFRHYGITRLAAAYVPVGPNTHVSLGISRGGRDFSDREMSILAEFQPLLAEGCRLLLRAERAERMLGASEEVLAAFGKGFVLVNSRGLVERMTAVAAAALTRIGFTMTINAPLPERLRVLATRAGCDGVSVRKLARASGEIFVVAETVATDPAGIFAPAGLTPRESEVLHWLAEGKGNAEIAAILGSAVGTVRKHLERVFVKLGVENRTAAVRRAMEIRAAGTPFGVFHG